jgi:hypothetical protein
VRSPHTPQTPHTRHGEAASVIELRPSKQPRIASAHLWRLSHVGGTATRRTSARPSIAPTIEKGDACGRSSGRRLLVLSGAVNEASGFGHVVVIGAKPHGVQIARPMPEILGPDERTGSDFGFLDCRLVASDDAVERVDERHVRYSVTVTQEATLGGKYSRPLFEIIGGGVT